MNANIYAALVHYPVKNKQGDVITTAITNLDLHDIARTVRTYGLRGYYVINPMPAQRELAGRIISHWVTGFGATYNPNRGEALSMIKIAASIEDAKAEIEAELGVRPKVVATAAKRAKGAAGYAEMRDVMADGAPYILAFGTGWGLTAEFLESADYVLMPIEGAGGGGGAGDYNHLPVRSAVAIILDRLFGMRYK